MAHELYENDTMFSVREKPWHGLGTIIQDHPSIEDAIIASGLNWKASLTKMKAIYQDQLISFDSHNAIVREDTKKVLGVVGNRYQIYQNSDMWDFIDTFQKQTGIKLETAGSLRNGRTTWVLATNGNMEVIAGDPIKEYFLFRNSFDGFTPISVLFTNIRVVCNNTLSAALKGSQNIFNVRHTASAEGKIKEVQKALGVRSKFQDKFKEGLHLMVQSQITESDTKTILENVIFPSSVEVSDKIIQMIPVSNKAETRRQNKIEKILELVETGAGSDIAGVRGTVYGLYNALTEYADHEKTTRTIEGRNESEIKFENSFFGTGATFKEMCFNELIKIAA